MSKYIIEIKPEYEDKFRGVMILGAENSNLYVDSNTVDELEELTSDYVKENFKDLLDAEYQRGFEDGVTKRTDGDACAGCEYKGKTGEHLPCHYCKNAYTNQWRAKKEEIGAGDVVKTCNGITYVVTKATIDGIVVGFAGDGSTCRFALSEVAYTGRHYNINEILGGLSDD